MPPLAIVGGIAAAGLVAGAVAGGSDKTQTQSTTNKNTSGVNLSPESSLQNSAQQGVSNDYNSLRDMVNSGPGQDDITRSVTNSRSLADMFGQYSQGGYMPNSQDISSSNSLAQNLFNPQQVALNQSFVDQTTQSNRQAALMGRDANDPILAAKLRTNMSNQQQMLAANQNAWAQQYALQQPMQRLGFAQQQNQMLGGLATQAMQNRQALASMGSSILGNERNYQLETSQRYNNGTSNNTQVQQGSLGGAISGGMAGLGAGLSAGSGLAGAMGGGGMGAASAGGGAMGGGGAGMMSGMNYSQSPSSFFGLGSTSSMGGGGSPFSGAPSSGLMARNYSNPSGSMFT
jgi:hypothetical protein